MRHCELVYNAYEVRMGASFDVQLVNPTATDSSQRIIPFSSLDVEVSGAAKIVWKRKSLRIKVVDEEGATPFITVRINGKSVFQESIPVLYDQEYRIQYRAKDGKHGRFGQYRWKCNLMHDHEIPLNDSDYCKMEYDMDEQSHGESGDKGMDLQVYVKMIPNGDRSRLIQVEMRNENGGSDLRYITPHAGKIFIETAGGNGGDGGRCVAAHYMTEEDTTATYIYPEPDLLFGQSGNGGDGGRGGNITVYITEEARLFYDHIYLDNPGGHGGRPYYMNYGFDGRKGEMGRVEILIWEPN